MYNSGGKNSAHIYYLIGYTILFISSIVLVQFFNFNLQGLLIYKWLIVASLLTAIYLYNILGGSAHYLICLLIPISIALFRPIIELQSLLALPDVYEKYHIKVFEIFIIVCLVITTKKVRLPKNINKPIFYFIVYVLIVFMSLIWAEDSHLGLANINKPLMLLISYWLFDRVFRERKKFIEIFLKGILALAFIQVIFSLPEFFGYSLLSNVTTAESAYIDKEIIRISGTMTTTNLATFFSAIIPLFFSISILYRPLNKNKRYFLLIITVLFFSILLLTRHRAHFVSTTICLVLIYLIGYKKKIIQTNSLAIFSILASVLSIPIVVFLFNSEVIMNIIFRETYLSRVRIYEIAWEKFLQNPLIGVGYNNLLVSKITDISLGWFKGGKTVHNDYLRILAENGLLGFMAFCAFLCSIFKYKSHNIKYFPISLGIKISIFGLLLISVTNVPFNKVHVMLLIGAFIAIIKNIKYK